MKNFPLNPLLSVVMPAYNGEKYLEIAIKSVLKQSYKHLEFFIIDDGSTDRTSEIIKNHVKIDRRIKPIHLKKHGGISNAMNVAIRRARGIFIVRTDGDDICLPNRFEKQIKYLLAHPEVDVLGSYFCTFFGNKTDECKTVPAYTDDIYNGRPPVHHPTCMIKRRAFDDYGYYDSKYDNAEDVELWFRWSSQDVRFDNLPEVLYKKRIHEGCVSTERIKSQVYLLLKINIMAITKYHMRFTIHGYLHILEQFFYLIYLILRLDKIYTRNKYG